MHTRIWFRYMLVAIIAAVTAGCSAGVGFPFGQRSVDLDTAITNSFGPVEQRVAVGDGWVLLSPPRDGGREIGYMTKVDGPWYLQGESHVLPASGTVTLHEQGGLVVVQTEDLGAPQFRAYKPTTDRLQAVDYYTVRAPEPEVRSGHFVLVNKKWNVLWHYRDGKLVKAYRVATGRQTDPPQPTWDDYRTNYFTPEGRFTLTNFTENPPYNALKPGDQSYVGGAPGNPLGTRWMGFEFLTGDNAWVWGIHGTSEPDLIGTWASDGCIRMYTAEAEALFAALRTEQPVVRIVGG